FNDRKGEYRWIRLEASRQFSEEGKPLLYTVYTDISEQIHLADELLAANDKAEHLINSIPGGIVIYHIEDDKFIPVFFTDGVSDLAGYTHEEYEQLTAKNAMDIIFEQDRGRIFAAARNMLERNEPLDVSYRIFHKDGSLLWIHMNAKVIGTSRGNVRVHAVITGMSDETRLFQAIANETADGIYIIDKDNYDLLYVNESKDLLTREPDGIGKKCYKALHGFDQPCEFCSFGKYPPDGIEHEMLIPGRDNIYSTRYSEVDWKGIPSYIVYIRDITDEAETRREKERLEQYFQTLIKNLPGGIAVVRCESDGTMTPEFISQGFADMTGMTMEQAWNLYREDATSGAHPEDRQWVTEELTEYVNSGSEGKCELIYRLIKGDGSYIWVKNTTHLLQSEDGGGTIYASYSDISSQMDDRKRLKSQYEELLSRHYKEPESNALLIGHCNVTQNRILDIKDHTNSPQIKALGTVREEFFKGISEFIVEDADREKFLQTYLNEPMTKSFAEKEFERIQECFVKLPNQEKGRYVRIKVILIESPDNGDVMGILTVVDITEDVISDLILHRLTVTNYDIIIDLDISGDSYHVLSHSEDVSYLPPSPGSHSQWISHMEEAHVVPKDRERYREALKAETILERLKEEDSYSFAFSIIDEEGHIRTKNMTVSPVDLRIGRVCLVRIDITESVREQQSMLNMMAYTFDLMGTIDVRDNRFTMYTRQMVLENLSPHVITNYDEAVPKFARVYLTEDGEKDAEDQFKLATMMKRLEETPEGYDFLFLHKSTKGEKRYKQVNVLWGDENHSTVCLVRADVTDVVAKEIETKEKLEQALIAAEQASKAKSEFLSSMSHDIRTPMNAIIGMTSLAYAHLGDETRVADCLGKISLSSKHLLSLVNDILDMSKIERSKITLHPTRLSLAKLIEETSDILAPQIRAANLSLDIQMKEIKCEHFYGDALRINQILINILSNAIKFTDPGGNITFTVEEREPSEDAGTGSMNKVGFRFIVKDTGRGMSEDFIAHMFEPFARSRGTEYIEGSGLGLSIIKGLVDLMGGSISVDSRPGEGTTFTVDLEFELAAEDEESSAGDAIPKPPEIKEHGIFKEKTFLIVEDNAINAELICELLKFYGGRRVVKQNGLEAVEEFECSEPGTYDAILMDIQMPVMNGYEATKAIRKSEHPDGQSIPIIAMTANAFAEDIQASKDAGMDDHVAKPIDMQVLTEALKKAFKKND
ncbi:MAG: PAS domain-containing protein, partial [Bacillota bacterium]|nr:PAS domain-containing protein [Bacillota bacterium]